MFLPTPLKPVRTIKNFISKIMEGYGNTVECKLNGDLDDCLRPDTEKKERNLLDSDCDSKKRPPETWSGEEDFGACDRLSHDCDDYDDSDSQRSKPTIFKKNQAWTYST